MDALQKNLAYLMAKHQTNPTQVAQATKIPQPTVYRILMGETKNPRVDTLQTIADHFRVSLEALRGTSLREADFSHQPAPIAQPFRQVPVVGHVKGGDNGYLEELDCPVDGYVEYPARDKNAYALRVRGDALRPRIRPGEFVIVEPNRQPHPGDDVVVIARDGRKLLKEFLYERNGEITFGSVNAEHAPISLPRTDILSIHYAAAIVPNGAAYQPI